MRAGVVCCGVCLSLNGLIWATPASAGRPSPIGQTYEFRVDSRLAAGGAPERTARGLRYTIHHPGATYIAIHFSEFDLRFGDYLFVSDATGGQGFRLEKRGNAPGGPFWAQYVTGDTAVLEWVQDGASPESSAFGFAIDEYAAGFADLYQREARDVCGADGKRNAACYADDPVYGPFYEKSRAVARLLVNGVWSCTGWLASPNDHLITNHHCIMNASEANNTTFEFLYEDLGCDNETCPSSCWCGSACRYMGSTLIKTNESLDYSLVRINASANPSPAASFGWLEIRAEGPANNEQIYIPQHPAGRAKELAVVTAYPGDDVCRASLDPGACNNGVPNQVEYSCDTEGGSSGSPVIAAFDNKVIALHHCSGCPNHAIDISLVCGDVCGPPGCTNCDDDNPCTVDVCNDGTCQHTGPGCGPADGCCPSGCAGLDPDCCGSAKECDDNDGCTTDACVDGICSYEYTECGLDDGCCPAVCDPGHDADCPCILRALCDDDDDCTIDECGIDGYCSHQPVTTCESGDSCCPAGCQPCPFFEQRVPCDSDCCQTKSHCNDNNGCTNDVCTGGICTRTPITACGLLDGCCPSGCMVCGGQRSESDMIELGDLCDPDCCNTHADCLDAAGCTNDICVSGTCRHNQILLCGPDDGCCPPGCSMGIDADCCLPRGARCTSNGQCCSNVCAGSPKKTCQAGPSK